MSFEPHSAPTPPSAALPGLEAAYLLPRDETSAESILAPVPHWRASGSRTIGEVAKVLNQGEGLLHWANRMGLEGKTLDEARTPRRSGGAWAHTAFTARAESPRPEGSGGILRWYAENDIMLVATERWMATTGEPPRVHGKADYLRFANETRTAVVVGDAKPIGRGKTWFESHVQVAGYAYCLEQAGVAVAGTEILLYDDRDYSVVPGVVSTNLFASLARLCVTIERLKAEL